jgi:cyclase
VLKHRVIPCLLLHDRGLVKTIRFAKPQYVGDPVNAIRIFNEKEVDELVVLDIDAGADGREPSYDLIADFAGECFMPLCYGGGIRSVEQARRLFSIGVEKVCVRGGALRDLQLVSDIAAKFGNQAVVVSVDVSKNFLGRYRLHPVPGVAKMPASWETFMTAAAGAGAGEILLNAVDRDGTMSGIDATLIAAAAKECRVPLIACGGVGSLADIKSAVTAGANAVAVGAFFVYHGPHRAVLITYPRHGDLVALLDA